MSMLNLGQEPLQEVKVSATNTRADMQINFFITNVITLQI
jgi:hypothetical protein